MNSQQIPQLIRASEGHTVGNVRALLTEIAALLENLNKNNEGGIIDLKSLPFSTTEYDLFCKILGRGEVSVHIEAIGNSEVLETAYPGLWRVKHFNMNGDVVADLLEIAWVPQFIKSQPEDVRAGLERLQIQLNE